MLLHAITPTKSVRLTWSALCWSDRSHCMSSHRIFTVAHIHSPEVPVHGHLFASTELKGGPVRKWSKPQHLHVSTNVATYRTPHSHWNHTIDRRKTRWTPDKIGHKHGLRPRHKFREHIPYENMEEAAATLTAANQVPTFQQAFKIVGSLALAQRWRHIQAIYCTSVSLFTS